MLEKNIMLVDGNDLIYNAIKHHLDKFIREVTVAPTGEIAMETLKRGHFDVAILNVNLPGMSGWEVLGEIRELSPETKVIVITATVAEDDRAMAMRRGAFDLLPQPFYLRRLDQAIYSAVCVSK